MQLRYSLCHRELLEHARLHGEELAAMHQQNIDFQLPNSKNQLQQVSISESGKFYKSRNASNVRVRMFVRFVYWTVVVI